MPVQKASDLSSQSRSVRQLTHGAGIVEEFSLQLCGQGIPPHDQRGPEASKDMLLVFGKSGIVWIRPKREGCFGNYSLAIARYPRAR